MNRGYAGFYNGVYLRSSYEYAYVKYLDFLNIKWQYEVQTYDLGYKIYKPDFFLYDKSNNLLKIVEVKSRDKKAQANAKKKIGEHTKRLWASDSIANQRMIEGLRKSGLSQKGKIKVPREIRICFTCKKEFEALITSKQQVYCCQSCGGRANIRKATLKQMQNREERYELIKQHITDWTCNNKEIIIQTPFNKIKTNLAPLLEEIQIQYGIKDFRIISTAIFNEDRGRKELLQYMKDIANKV
ncbi:restriction endonuclease [Bacillus songklensis]|uniref:Restriction endonuclease n=1 Tax=Bacillus songklensis TaxID=1069116 RepID=A0ABV8B0Y3_9BACI